MSNATQPSRQSGDSRRRRSRGGNNRNRNNQNNDRGPRDSKSNRSGGPRPKRGPRKVELTFWQKLLKAIGLYKEPTRSTTKKRKDGPKPKSNTRNARSDDSAPKKSPRSNRSRGGYPSTVESARVYVGNLSYDVTEQDLQELYKGVGPVRSAEIVYNRNTHRSKGYGFVEMLHQDDAVRCVEVLNDQPFMGRNMIVSGAKSKGNDSRDEQDETVDTKAQDIELAPLPDQAASDLPEFPESGEPEIKTIVEEPVKSESTETEEGETEKKSSDA